MVAGTVELHRGNTCEVPLDGDVAQLLGLRHAVLVHAGLGNPASAGRLHDTYVVHYQQIQFPVGNLEGVDYRLDFHRGRGSLHVADLELTRARTGSAELRNVLINLLSDLVASKAHDGVEVHLAYVGCQSLPDVILGKFQRDVEDIEPVLVGIRRLRTEHQRLTDVRLAHKQGERLAVVSAAHHHPVKARTAGIVAYLVDTGRYALLLLAQFRQCGIGIRIEVEAKVGMQAIGDSSLKTRNQVAYPVDLLVVYLLRGRHQHLLSQAFLEEGLNHQYHVVLVHRLDGRVVDEHQLVAGLYGVVVRPHAGDKLLGRGYAAVLVHVLPYDFHDVAVVHVLEQFRTQGVA